MKNGEEVRDMKVMMEGERVAREVERLLEGAREKALAERNREAYRVLSEISSMIPSAFLIDAVERVKEITEIVFSDPQKAREMYSDLLRENFREVEKRKKEAEEKQREITHQTLETLETVETEIGETKMKIAVFRQGIEGANLSDIFRRTGADVIIAKGRKEDNTVYALSYRVSNDKSFKRVKKALLSVVDEFKVVYSNVRTDFYVLNATIDKVLKTLKEVVR